MGMSRSLKLNRAHQRQKFQNHFGQLHTFMAVLLLCDHSQHGNTILLAWAFSDTTTSTCAILWDSLS